MANAQGKFGALAEINGRKKGELVPLPSRQTKAAGKRSNPDYKQFTVQLRKQTHRDATEILRRRDDGTDFGDLVQSLLEGWLAAGVK